jgi:hypothetical protein
MMGKCSRANTPNKERQAASLEIAQHFPGGFKNLGASWAIPSSEAAHLQTGQAGREGV